MKLRHKYLNPIIVYLIVYMFGLLLFGFSLMAVNGAYTYLNHLMPNIFPLYNPIYAPEAKEKVDKALSVIAIFVALFLINFIALKLENKKYERLITHTDGQYILKDGIRLYFREFWKADIITSALVPALISIPPFFIPEKILSRYALIIPNWLGYHMGLIYGLVPTVLTVAVFSYIGRMLSVPLCVRSWRAAWLSDI